MNWELFVERIIGAFKYLLAGVMMLSGVQTMFVPTIQVDGLLGIIYGSRISLVIFGLIVFASGAILLYGKITKSKRWTGVGLMSVYCCLLFATIIQLVAFSTPDSWVANGIMALITGALWLRWRFKTAYINPNHFRPEIRRIKEEERQKLL